MQKRYKKLWIALAIIGIVLIGSVIGCTVYINDYYHAEDMAVTCMAGTDTVTVTTLENKNIVFAPENPKEGFIFYPGGKVEYTAYAPLMEELAKQGFLCVLVKMPANLAVFDSNAADGIQELYPGIENWYIGGHSLGGAMAASYVSKHVDEYEGLVLLAAYSTADLAESGLNVITIYGSEDGVLNREKLEKYENNLPADAKTVIIQGGCHAYFGYYGEQDGDGTATITKEEQIQKTVEAILNNE